MKLPQRVMVVVGRPNRFRLPGTNLPTVDDDRDVDFIRGHPRQSFSQLQRLRRTRPVSQNRFVHGMRYVRNRVFHSEKFVTPKGMAGKKKRGLPSWVAAQN